VTSDSPVSSVSALPSYFLVLDSGVDTMGLGEAGLPLRKEDGDGGADVSWLH
jgi:hypothetical protein